MANKKDKEILNFVSDLAGESFLKIEEDLGKGFVKLRVDEAEKRQAQHDIREAEDIVIELLRNSRDAGARRIFIATIKHENNHREICIIDDGSGIPSEYAERIFEPRVTSKLTNLVFDKYGVHGRGMALYAIRSNAENAQVVSSKSGQGAIIRIIVDSTRLPEKKNQSMRPAVIKDRNGIRLGKGVKNLWKVIIDFWIDHQEIELYFGSPAEIAATLCDLVNREPAGQEVLYECLRGVKKAPELTKTLSEKVGLDISERNSYRILKREIEPVLEMRDLIAVSRLSAKKGGQKKKISRADLDDFSGKVKKLAKKLTSGYLLKLNDVKIRQESDKIKITIDFEGKDKV